MNNNKKKTWQFSFIYSFSKKMYLFFIKQAVPCRLVSDDNEIIQWNEEDILSFELHTNNKTYKAHIFSCSNDIYDVSLINDDGKSFITSSSFVSFDLYNRLCTCFLTNIIDESYIVSYQI